MAVSSKPSKLESGDRLTRAEFHRRYLASPRLKKAELVEGVVYVPSPVSTRHGDPHGRVLFWLNAFRMGRSEILVHDNTTVILDADNEVQPDACLWRKQADGPRLNQDGFIEGAPQVVVEIAASSASYDLHDKLNAYRRAGVLEYIVWRVDDGAIDWLRLHEGAYTRVEPDDAGVIESTTFPGLRLNVRKMLAGDLAGVLADLEPRGWNPKKAYICAALSLLGLVSAVTATARRLQPYAASLFCRLLDGGNQRV
jgi:Uma2 family endonuclease